jgi:hypothetical protein
MLGFAVAIAYAVKGLVLWLGWLAVLSQPLNRMQLFGSPTSRYEKCEHRSVSEQASKQSTGESTTMAVSMLVLPVQVPSPSSANVLYEVSRRYRFLWSKAVPATAGS